MSISDVEKCARLMGMSFREIEGRVYSSNREFNPLKNKADLMDLECALVGLDLRIGTHAVEVQVYIPELEQCGKYIGLAASYSAHGNDRFTARAHAVIAVAVQVYDRTNP